MYHYLVKGISFLIILMLFDGYYLQASATDDFNTERFRRDLNNSQAINNNTIENGTQATSGVENLTAACDRDYARYLDALATQQPWALRMFDAFGKTEISGAMSGHLLAEGFYTQCRNTKEEGDHPQAIQALYCLADWEVPYYSGRGICIPDTCTNIDAEILLRINTPAILPDAQVEIKCVKDPDISKDTAAKAAIGIFGVFGALIFLATACHGAKQLIYSLQASHEDEHQARYDVKDKDLKSSRDGNGVVTEHDNPVFVISDEEKVSSHDLSTNSNGVKLRNVKALDPENDSQGPMANGHNTDVVHMGDGASKDKEEVPTQGKLESLLLAFSLLNTLPAILRAENSPGTYECINGLRFLTMCWIVLGHTYMLGVNSDQFFNIVNPADLYGENMETWHYLIIGQMGLAVDTFFIISGFLVAVTFLQQLKIHSGRLGPRRWIMHYVHRYWRLTPVYAAVILFFGTLYVYTVNGPFMPDYITSVAECEDNWWKNILYVQNLFGPSWCLGWTWYLACDMQFYIIAPLFLVIIHINEKVGVPILVAGVFGGIVANIVLFYEFFRDEGGILDFYYDIYVTPWTRCVPYLMGMTLGWAIHKYGRNVRIPRIVNVIGWCIACGLCAMVVFGERIKMCADSFYCDEWTIVEKTAFNALEKPTFALVICWVLFSCSIGYGGIINTWLSWSFFIPLARLTYVGYLVHPIICYTFFYASPVQVYYYDYFWGVYLFLGNLTLAMGLSLFISAAFEVPFATVEKIIFPSRK